MKRVGTASGLVLCTLNPTEFKSVTGEDAADTADQETFDLTRLENLAGVLENNKAKLIAIRASALTLIAAIEDLV